MTTGEAEAGDRVVAVQDRLLDDVYGTPYDGGAPSAGRVFAAIAFVDIVQSTEIATRLGDRTWRDLLDAFHQSVHRAISSAGGERVNTLGDGVFAAFSTATAAVRWSQAIHQVTRRLGLTVRVGIHATEVERRGRDLAGIGIHVAARVAGTAPPGGSIVTNTVRDLLDGSMIELVDRGDHDLVGINRPWRLFAVPAASGNEAELVGANVQGEPAAAALSRCRAPTDSAAGTRRVALPSPYAGMFP